MGFLSALAAIPTVANLALKLRDTEAELKLTKDKTTDLESQNATLKKTVSDLNAQVIVLTRRITSFETGDPTQAMLAAIGIPAASPRDK